LAAVFLTLVVAEEAFSQTPDDNHGYDKADIERQISSMPDVVDPAAAAAMSAKLNADRQLAHENYVNWLDDFNKSGIDPRSLERLEEQVDFAPPPATGGEALKAATLIVSGTATNVEFRPSPHDVGEVIVTFAISDVASGNVSGDSITLSFGGGPHPVPESLGEPHNAVMSYLPAAPLLLPGDQALLLLGPAASGNAQFEPKAWFGVNPIEGGSVTTNEASPLRSMLEGKSVDEAVQSLKIAAGAR
jgi:hypothetical protein